MLACSIIKLGDKFVDSLVDLGKICTVDLLFLFTFLSSRKSQKRSVKMSSYRLEEADWWYTYKEDDEAGFAGERSMLKLSFDLFGDVVFGARVEFKSGIGVLVVKVHGSVVLVHASAGPAPIQMQVDHYINTQLGFRVRCQFCLLIAGSSKGVVVTYRQVSYARAHTWTGTLRGSSD